MRLLCLALVTLTGCQRNVVEAAPASQPAAASQSAAAAIPAVESTPATTPAAEPTLAYTEVVLGADPDARLPLVIAVHGLGDRPERFIRLFDGFDTPVRVIAPRAPTERRSGGFTWFPGLPADRDLTPLVTGASSSAALLAEFIAAVRERRPTCGAPVVTGFSQGGLLTLALAVHHSEVVGAAIPVGGWLPPPMWPEQRAAGRLPEIDALHGERDALVPLRPTQAGNQHLRDVGFDIEMRTYPTGHTISKDMRRDLFELLTAAIADVARCD